MLRCLAAAAGLALSVPGAPALAEPVQATAAGATTGAATSAACASAPTGVFDDVAGVHASAVDCVRWWGLADGVGAGRFAPGEAVRRDQIASFLLRLLGVARPPATTPVPDAFTDDDGTTHEAAINRLAQRGVITGVADGRYGPAGPLTRGQMATLLARAWQQRTGRALPAGADAFGDDDGTAHEVSIDQVAAAGLVGGVTATSYQPTATVTRAQMATFLARFLARLVEAGDLPAAPDTHRPGWRLAAAETFDDVPVAAADGWTRDTDGRSLGPFDDDGAAFHVKGGPAFAAARASFDTYRTSYRFGQDGWLTAELATRDQGRTGRLGDLPTVTTRVLADGRRVGHLSVPANTDGAIIRPTRPLPARYRVEYELTTLDFGGPRAGVWDYDGLRNGYRPDGCATQHPWTASARHPTSPEVCDFADVRGENGFYFLGIVDHADPKPRNNVFIHDRRKVVIDQYQVATRNGAAYRVCDPATGETYSHHDPRSGAGIPVNMLFLTDDNQRSTGFVSNEFLMETACGSFFGGDAGTTIVSAAELRPDLLPGSTYRFAIERTATGYVLEVAGRFLHGDDVLRYERGFVQDGHPIWHYNQRPDEYAGAFDRQHRITGPYGSHDMGSLWPAGSAYPDAFVIGVPHTNYYAGSASIDDLRLYLPAG